MLRNTATSYGWLSRLLHWTVSIMIFILLGAGYYMTSEPPKYDVYPIHKATGFVLLILVILRLTWRLNNTNPDLPSTTPHWQAVAANLNIKVLYALMLAQPISGILMSLYDGHAISVYGLFIIPAFVKNEKLSILAKEFHSAFAVLLILAITLHVLGGLYHHFIRKDNVLVRMIKG